jgi:hypothetical protein
MRRHTHLSADCTPHTRRIAGGGADSRIPELSGRNGTGIRRNGTGIRRNSLIPPEWHRNGTGIRHKGLTGSPILA